MTSPDPRRRLERMVIEAVSPDGILMLRIRTGPTVSLTAVPRGMDHYRSTQQLEQQLVAVLGQGFTAWRSSRRRLLAEVFHRRSGLGPVREPAVGTATSPSGRVRLAARGGVRWRCRLDPDALGELSGAELLAEVESTVSAALRDHATRSRRTG